MKNLSLSTLFSLSLLFLFSPTSLAQGISFAPASPAPTFQDADAGAMAFADVDQDGDMDLLLTGKGGPIKTTLYLNDGSGNFSEVMNAPFEPVFGGAVGFADIDNDNDLDLLITGNPQLGDRSAKLYENDGSGNYSLVSGTPFEPNWGGDLAFGDIDNDGDADLVMTGINEQDQGLTRLYENQNVGSGVFVEITGSPLESVGNSAVEFIDFDNDNDLDIILAGENNQGTNVTHLYANNGMGSFSLLANTPFDGVQSGDIAIADTDQDGDEDILISGEVSGGMAISKLYLNDGMGGFSLLTGTPFLGASTGETDFADFDNDGDMDVLITGFGTAIISNIYENLGSNGFALADSLPGAYASSTAIGDMDGDNDLDIVIGGTSFTLPARSTKTYLNQSPGANSISQQQSLSGVSLFPNPSRGVFQVKAERQQMLSIQVYSASGKRVYQARQVPANSPIHLNQPPGLYLALISFKGVTSRQKLILQP
jgi:hypothetical protein